MMAKVEMARLDEPQDRPFFDRLSVWPTLTVNGLPQRLRRTRHQDRAALRSLRQVRHPPGGIPKRGRDHGQSGRPRRPPRAGGRVHPPGGHGAVQDAPGFPLHRAAARAIRTATGEEPLLIPAMGGSLPDYVWTKILGVHSFITPYANHDEANHAPEREFGSGALHQRHPHGGGGVGGVGQIMLDTDQDSL